MAHQRALQLAESIQGMISRYQSSLLSHSSHIPGLLIENYGICLITPPVKINESMKHQAWFVPNDPLWKTNESRRGTDFRFLTYLRQFEIWI